MQHNIDKELWEKFKKQLYDCILEHPDTNIHIAIALHLGPNILRSYQEHIQHTTYKDDPLINKIYWLLEYWRNSKSNTPKEIMEEFIDVVCPRDNSLTLMRYTLMQFMEKECNKTPYECAIDAMCEAAMKAANVPKEEEEQIKQYITACCSSESNCSPSSFNKCSLSSTALSVKRIYNLSQYKANDTKYILCVNCYDATNTTHKDETELYLVTA